MPKAPGPLPDSLAFTVFSTQEARRAGVTRGRLQASDLKPVSRGLWARTGAVLTEFEIVGALCRRDPSAFAMGLTAARVLGLPLPGVFSAPAVLDDSRRAGSQYSPKARSDGRIHLGTTTCPRRDTAMVRWSLVTPDVVTLPLKSGVRTTSRIHTYLDLANVLGTDALVAIVDHLVRKPRPHFEGRTAPFATISQLGEAALRHRGRGARRIREAVSLVRMSSDSPPETALRLAMVRARLPEPLANAPAVHGGPEGAVLALGEPDLHWPQWRVALEHEGPSHLESNQLAKDIARADRRRDADWIEVRTTFKDLPHGCRAAVAKVRRVLESRGWRAE